MMMRLVSCSAVILALLALAAAMVLPEAEVDQHLDYSPLLRQPRAVGKYSTSCVARKCDFGCRANHGHPGGWCTRSGCECTPIPPEMQGR